MFNLTEWARGLALRIAHLKNLIHDDEYEICGVLENLDNWEQELFKLASDSERSCTVRSSYGHFVFDRLTGAILEIDLDPEFGPLPVGVDIHSLREECDAADVLDVGYFYIDAYDRRQYEPPAPHRDVRCPNCGAPFEAGCACFPVAYRSPRGTVYVDGKEYTKSTFEGVL